MNLLLVDVAIEIELLLSAQNQIKASIIPGGLGPGAHDIPVHPHVVGTRQERNIVRFKTR
jgi:hypothetical protein